MASRRLCAVTGLVAGMLAVLPVVRAQQNVPRIGYVYPAGGQTGTTCEVVVGGQFLLGLTNVLVSGDGVQATIEEVIRPITGKALNDLRIQVDELLARKAVVKKDFKALENFRTFKNAKTLKADTAVDDKEIEALKQKYANATWTADDETLLAEVRKKASGGNRRPDNPAIAELAILRMAVAPDAAPGDREIRLVTAQGLTNPRLFKVGLLPEFAKPAATNIPEKTIPKEMQAGPSAGAREKTDVRITTLPVVVNGQILPGAADRFRFAARKGMRMVIASSARELIPYLADAVPGWFQATLALYDASNREVAYDDGVRFSPDPVLYYEIPEDGDYVLEIRDSIYRGREDFVYRIMIGEAPFITRIFPLGGQTGTTTTVALNGWNLATNQVVVDNRDKAPGLWPVSVRKADGLSNLAPFAVDALPECMEKEPNSQRRTAQAVSLPVIVNGRIDRPDDRDFYTFTGKAGQELVAEVYARRLNSPLDSKLVVCDAGGKQLVGNDDWEDKSSGLETHHADSYIRATLPADGAYYVEIVDTQHQGGPEYAYRLRISAPQPDFTLRVVPSSINLRVGGTVPVTLYARRHDGFTNAIAIALKDSLPGFKLSGTSISPTQDQVRVTLTAPPAIPTQPVQLSFEGRATIDGRVVVHPAVPAEDMMQAFAYRHLVPSKELRVGILQKGVKILSALPIKLPAGGTVIVKLGDPAELLSNRTELELSEPSVGVTIQKRVSSTAPTELVLVADADKVTVGQKGSLIVAVYLNRADPSATERPEKNRPRIQLPNLPAIPFEIVSP